MVDRVDSIDYSFSLAKRTWLHNDGFSRVDNDSQQDQFYPWHASWITHLSYIRDVFFLPHEGLIQLLDLHNLLITFFVALRWTRHQSNIPVAKHIFHGTQPVLPFGCSVFSDKFKDLHLDPIHEKMVNNQQMYNIDHLNKGHLEGRSSSSPSESSTWTTFFLFLG